MAFSFGFSGDDIEPTNGAPPVGISKLESQSPAAAFPLPGKPQLPPSYHPLKSLVSQLPSKIAYNHLEVTQDDGSILSLPRRELWDVRVQLMAEDEGLSEEGTEGLGQHDVKTGVYEGGFKSWESSVDLVKVLAADAELPKSSQPLRVIELGCGTALPSLAIFHWASSPNLLPRQLHFIISDYNPTVLQLVTLPNFILTWAIAQRAQNPLLEDALAENGELELTPEIIQAFQDSLREKQITLSFVSGGWSEEFLNLIHTLGPRPAIAESTYVLGAETIYSPFALQAFTEAVFGILDRSQSHNETATALVAAKNMYFGVGGSLDDFVATVQERGAIVTTIRTEVEGVRRGVVRCMLGKDTAEV